MGECSPSQEESQAQKPQISEDAEPSSTQPETPTQYPELLEESGASPAQTEATVLHPKPLEEVKPAARQEPRGPHSEPPGEVEPSLIQQEALAQPLSSLTEL